MAIYQTAIWNTHYNPIFSDEWSESSMIEETSFSTPSLSPSDQFEPNTLQIWEHFHSMPAQGDQTAWNQFFDRQNALENPAPVTTSAFVFHQLRSPLAEEASVEKTESLFKTKPAERGIPDKPEIKVLPKLLHEDVRFRCPIKACNTIYNRKADLRDHMYSAHPEEKELFNALFKLTPKRDKKFPCSQPDCKSGYSRLNDLNQHLQKKHNIVEPTQLVEKPYPCPSLGCRSSYFSKKSLRQHVRKNHL